MFLYGVRKNKKEDVFEKSSGNWDEVCYWRKANQIHKWFNVHFIKQQDPWGFYEVDEKSLQGLLLLCKLLLHIKKNPSEEFSWVETDYFKRIKENYEECSGLADCADLIAYALLPPDNIGCFFGSGIVDEYYWEDIENSIEQLESALNKNYDTYFYCASW